MMKLSDGENVRRHGFSASSGVPHSGDAKSASAIFSLIGMMLLLCLSASFAMEPPRPGELTRYLQDGTLAARKSFADRTGNWRVSPNLISRRLSLFQAQQSNRLMGIESFPYQTGLPSKGTPRVFALLIDFPDHPHSNAESVFSNKLFGTGNEDQRPYESLREYYRRSSYYYTKPAGQALDIQGEVLPWYRAKKNRTEYTSATDLIEEALDSFAASRDFAVYDNNGDGKIDFFMVFYSGPETGWGSLWWAWCDSFKDPL